MAKLVCDRCGREVSRNSEIEQILAGADAYMIAVRNRGEEPRGIYPCKNYRNCGGQMVVAEK